MCLRFTTRRPVFDTISYATSVAFGRLCELIHKLNPAARAILSTWIAQDMPAELFLSRGVQPLQVRRVGCSLWIVMCGSVTCVFEVELASLCGVPAQSCCGVSINNSLYVFLIERVGIWVAVVSDAYLLPPAPNHGHDNDTKGRPLKGVLSSIWWCILGAVSSARFDTDVNVLQALQLAISVLALLHEVNTQTAKCPVTAFQNKVGFRALISLARWDAALELRCV